MNRGIALLLLAGCYDPQLGTAPPFRCEEGACPDGYRCAQALCVADGQPDPPVLVSDSSSESAPPQPVWDDDRGRFAVFSLHNLGAPPGVRLAVPDEGIDGPVVPAAGDVAFAAIYHHAARRYLVVVRSNDDTGHWLRAISATLDGGPRAELTCLPGYAPLGFSVPSLVVGPGTTATLAATFGALPNNVYWTRLDLAAPPRADCQLPSLQSSVATEVTLAEAPEATLFFWRGGFVHITGVQNGVQMGDLPTPLLHVARAVRGGPDLGLAAQVVADDNRKLWVMRLQNTQVMEPGPNGPTIPTQDMVPDVVAHGDRFLVCVRGVDGELALHRFAVADLRPVGVPIAVPRYSRAPIASCRLAAAPQSVGKVAVAWQERVPPSSVRDYLEVIPLPP